MVTGKDILERLTVRNTLALSFAGVFLYAVITAVNQEAGITWILNQVDDMTAREAIAVGAIGGGIGGVFFAMVKDMWQFYFRASGRKPEEPKP